MLALLLCMTVAAQAAPREVRIAVPDIQLSGVADERLGSTLTETLVAETAKVDGAAVISASDIRDLLGFEQQRQLLGCDDASCLAEVSGALGVDLLLVSKLDLVEGSWSLNLKLLQTSDARVLGRVNRVIRGDADAVLADLHGAARELLLAIATPPVESAAPAIAIWSMIGVGGASLVTAAVLEVWAGRKYDQAAAHHSIDYVFAEDYELHSFESREHFDTAQKLSRAALGLAIGGAALAAGGVTWLLVRHQRAARLEIRPAVGADLAILFVQGSW